MKKNLDKIIKEESEDECINDVVFKVGKEKLKDNK
jgi:hypothetical protein